MSESEIGTGKTIFVISVVLGCFAILYPKIFYHMMFDEKKDKPEHVRPPHEFGRPPMHSHPALHMRNEQGKLFYGEEGRQVRRTIDKELKPGPVPGMRPSMGGPGIPQSPRGGNQGGGTMGILMPLYTTGIVVFFVYTVMKIVFKKNDDSLEGDERPSRRLHQSLNRQNVHPEYLQPTATPAPKPYVKKEPSKKEVIQSTPVIKEAIPTPLVIEPVEKKVITENCDPRDEQIRMLKERLEETEKAMQMIVSHMAAISSQMPAQQQPASNEEQTKTVLVQPDKDAEDDEENDAKEASKSEIDSDDETDEEDAIETATPKEIVENLDSIPLPSQS